MYRLSGLICLVLAACSSGMKADSATTCRPPECTPQLSSYAVEITAAGNAGTINPPTELTQVALDATTGLLALSLPAEARISGRMLSAGVPVMGSVVITRPSRIAGRPDVYYETTVDPVTGAYSVGVSPNVAGESYTIRARPTNSTTYPPLTLTQSFTSDTSLDLQLPSGTDLLTVRGTIADAVSVAIGGAQVVLRDAATLDALSTTTMTSSTGAFSLQVSSVATGSASGLILVATSGDVSTSAGQLTLTLPLSAAQITDAPMSLTATKLQLPALPATTHLIIPVSGTGTNGTTTAIQGAAYRLVTTLGATVNVSGSSALQVVHEIDGTTTPDGNIEADLYSNGAGTRAYTVTIVPPADTADAQFGSLTTGITVGTSSGVTQQITLPLRPLVSGLVLDSTGAVVKGATIQPTLSTILATTGTSSLTAYASTTTGPDGRFGLRVDPGTYNIGVSPPAGTALPRRWLTRLVVSSDLDLSDMPIALPAGVTFSTTVLDAMQMPVQATVDLYFVPASDPDCATYAASTTTSCVAAPQLEAETDTSASGTATMLLPAN